MRFRLPRLQSKRARLTVFLILIVVILGGSSGGYYLYKNKSSADAVTSPLYDALAGVPLSDGACNNNIDNERCKSISQSNSGHAGFEALNAADMVKESYEKLYISSIQECIQDNSVLNWFINGRAGDAKDISKNYDCHLTVTDPYQVGNNRGIVKIKTELNASNAGLETLHKSKTTTDSSVNNIEGIMSLEADVDLVTTHNTQNLEIYNPNLVWPKFNGSTQMSFEINLDSNEDTFKYNNFKTADFSPNRTLSHSFLKTTGKTYGQIKFANDTAGNLVINDFSFCDKGCEIENTVEVYLVGNKIATTTDKFAGGVVSLANHTEKYSGTMSTLKDTNGHFTGTVKWNPDVKIMKNDTRNWKHKFTNTLDTNAYYNYTGNLFSTAELRPFDAAFGKDGYSRINTKITKTFQSKLKSSPLRDIYLTEDISIGKNENTLNGVFTRTGMGIRTSGASYQATADKSYQRGIYDNNNDGKMLVTESKGYTLGSRIDLIGDYIKPEYVKSYLDNAAVGGFFTAGYFFKDANKTVFFSRAVKAIPHDISILLSFPTNDPTFSATEVNKITAFFDNLKKEFNINVTFYDTNSGPKFQEALRNIPNNSWVVNIGHGGPTGLKFGDNYYTWSRINNLLSKYQLKFDVFAASSCYSAHANIAQTIIGSVGVGLSRSSDLAGGLNTLVGQGGNYFTQTTSQLLDQIRALVPAKPDPGI